MAECTNCGSFISADYQRVFGNNDGIVEDCRHCPPTRHRETDDDSDGDDEQVVLLREVRGSDADISSGRGGIPVPVSGTGRGGGNQGGADDERVVGDGSVDGNGRRAGKSATVGSRETGDVGGVSDGGDGGDGRSGSDGGPVDERPVTGGRKGANVPKRNRLGFGLKSLRAVFTGGE